MAAKKKKKSTKRRRRAPLRVYVTFRRGNSVLGAVQRGVPASPAGWRALMKSLKKTADAVRDVEEKERALERAQKGLR